MFRVTYYIFGSRKTREFETESEAQVFASKMRNALVESNMVPKQAWQSVQVEKVS